MHYARIPLNINHFSFYDEKDPTLCKCKIRYNDEPLPSEQCPCGSGKIFKKCCWHNNKDKHCEVELFFKCAVPIACGELVLTKLGISLYINNFKVQIFNSELTIYYERKNKTPKFLSKLISASDPAPHSPDNIFFSNDYIFAVDTNTDNKSGLSCCAIASVKADDPTACFNIDNTGMKIGKSAGEVNIELVSVFINNLDNPEKLGLHILLDMIIKSGINADGARIGIISDHDMGNIGNFSLGKQPYIRNYYLPKNFSLFYASADSNNKLINYAISFCDKASKQYLQDSSECNDAAASAKINSNSKINATIVYINQNTLFKNLIQSPMLG